MDEPTKIDPASSDGDEMEALREALDDLRREIDVRLHGASDCGNADRAVAQLFDQARRSLSTLGVSAHDPSVDEFGFDRGFVDGVKSAFDLLFDRYWRVEVTGLSNVPQGPCLLVANRSGVLPYDAVMFCHAWERERGAAWRPRFTVADWLITLPFAQPNLARLGGVRACRENVERLLASGRPVLVFPEGVKGAAKPFRERYRLQRFGRGGVIRMALETGVPVIPVGIVGPEEAHPILFKWVPPGRSLPFVPVTPTFPWLGPLGMLPLPTKWRVHVGNPIDLASAERDAAQDELLLSRLTEELRHEVQELIHCGLDARSSVWS